MNDQATTSGTDTTGEQLPVAIPARSVLVRTTVTIPPEVLKLAKELAARQQTTLGHVLRRGVEVQILLREAVRDGGHIAIHGADGSVTRLALFS